MEGFEIDKNSFEFFCKPIPKNATEVPVGG
jgi:hypothetical protein